MHKKLQDRSTKNKIRSWRTPMLTRNHPGLLSNACHHMHESEHDGDHDHVGQAIPTSDLRVHLLLHLTELAHLPPLQL